LEDHGLVDRDPVSNRYSVGFAVTRMAVSAGTAGLVRRAHPVLQRLCQTCGQTADLAVIGRLGLTYVDEVAPPSVLAANWLGRPVPLHATSSGKTMLAWLPSAEVDALLAAGLPRYTETTVTSKPALLAELDQTRARGFGVCVGELEPTLNGVSAPVLDGRARPVAVLSIWGLSHQVTPQSFGALGALAQQAAADVAAAAQLAPR
jgi:DNA-binding IclR family transcriptional regulator